MFFLSVCVFALLLSEAELLLHCEEALLQADLLRPQTPAPRGLQREIHVDLAERLLDVSPLLHERVKPDVAPEGPRVGCNPKLGQPRVSVERSQEVCRESSLLQELLGSQRILGCCEILESSRQHGENALPVEGLLLHRGERDRVHRGGDGSNARRRHCRETMRVSVAMKTSILSERYFERDQMWSWTRDNAFNAFNFTNASVYREISGIELPAEKNFFFCFGGFWIFSLVFFYQSSRIYSSRGMIGRWFSETMMVLKEPGEPTRRWIILGGGRRGAERLLQSSML